MESYIDMLRTVVTIHKINNVHEEGPPIIRATVAPDGFDPSTLDVMLWYPFTPLGIVAAIIETDWQENE